MTAVALGAESALVLIVSCVTADTGIWGSDLYSHRFAVAIVTIECLVGAIQHESCLDRVIELP